MSDEPEKRYYFTYEITPHPEGVTREQMTPNQGAADAILLVSIVGESGKPEPYSTQWMSIRGPEQKNIDANEMWHLWTLLTKNLADSPDLPRPRREYCAAIFEEIRQAVLANRR